MIELFASSFVLGLFFNAIPGAVFAESLRQGLRGGFGPAFSVQVGSLAGDFVWAVLGLLGAAALFALPYVEIPLALAGAALLLWIAWEAVLDSFRPIPTFDKIATSGKVYSGLRTGAALSLSNPMNITYWAGLGGTVTALGVTNPGWAAFAIFLSGFMASSVVWCFLCAGFVVWTRRFIGPRTWMVLNFGCAAGLCIFAGLAIVRTTI